VAKTKKPDEMTEAELAEFYEKRAGDLTLWEKKPRRMRRRRGEGPSTSFAVRVTPGELEELAAAAQKAETTLSDFIRSAALGAARAASGASEAGLRRVLLDTQEQLQAVRSSLEKALERAG